jgi:hypothetical protein
MNKHLQNGSSALCLACSLAQAQLKLSYSSPVAIDIDIKTKELKTLSLSASTQCLYLFRRRQPLSLPAAIQEPRGHAQERRFEVMKIKIKIVFEIETTDYWRARPTETDVKRLVNDMILHNADWPQSRQITIKRKANHDHKSERKSC